MNKNLENLINGYTKLLDNSNTTPLKVTNVSKDRSKIYNQLQKFKVALDEKDILTEFKHYMLLVKVGILNTKMPHSLYATIVEAFLNSFKDVEPFLSETNMSRVLTASSKMVVGVREHLKKHPNLAGMKIRILKQAIKQIDKLNEKYLNNQEEMAD